MELIIPSSSLIRPTRARAGAGSCDGLPIESVLLSSDPTSSVLLDQKLNSILPTLGFGGFAQLHWTSSALSWSLMVINGTNFDLI